MSGPIIVSFSSALIDQFVPALLSVASCFHRKFWNKKLRDDWRKDCTEEVFETIISVMSSKEVFPRPFFPGKPFKSQMLPKHFQFYKRKGTFLITIDQLIGQNQIWESSFSLHDYLDWGFSGSRGSNRKKWHF